MIISIYNFSSLFAFSFFPLCTKKCRNFLERLGYILSYSILLMNNILVELEKSDGGVVEWSSHDADNQGSCVRIPVLRTREEDTNRDGIMDSLWLRLQMRMEPREDVVALQSLITFNYQLHRYSVSICIKKLSGFT